MQDAITEDANYLRKVREQYENYPYPPRNPEDEKSQFFYSLHCAFDSLNHFHFEGRRDFTKGFRSLTAGAGTGDSTIMLAEQCRGTDAEIIHLDISRASIEVAKSRAKIRGLDNITFIHGSLLDAPKLVKGKFDYINCSGVLHHLASPEEGLATLSTLLKDDGVMGLMLYGLYGREPIYQVQRLMRMLNQNEPNVQQQVENCKIVLCCLKPSHTYRHIEASVTDVHECGDNGIYDLFLHSQDRAYTVPQVYEFLAGADLIPTHFLFDESPLGADLYRAEHYFPGNAMAKALAGRSLPEKQAIAELMHGRMAKHAFYAARRQPKLPDVNDEEMVPNFCMFMMQEERQRILQTLQQTQAGETMKAVIHGRQHTWVKTLNMQPIFEAIDGERTIAQVIDTAMKSDIALSTGAPREAITFEFGKLFAALHHMGWMFLRHRDVPRTKSAQECFQDLRKYLAQQT